MVDQFSTWVEICAIPDKMLNSTVKPAMDQFYSQFKFSLQLQSDQRKNFDWNVMRILCKLNQISKLTQLPTVPVLIAK